MLTGEMIIEGKILRRFAPVIISSERSVVPKQRWGKPEALMFLLLLEVKNKPIIDSVFLELEQIGKGNLEPQQAEFPDFNSFFNPPKRFVNR